VYDTSGPQDQDVVKGLPKLRAPWVGCRRTEACVTQLAYARKGDITPEMDRAIKAAIPMGRVGDPEDIAYGSVYLCSDEAKYVTATEMVIDGGWGAG